MSLEDTLSGTLNNKYGSKTPESQCLGQFGIPYNWKTTPTEDYSMKTLRFQDTVDTADL